MPMSNPIGLSILFVVLLAVLVAVTMIANHLPDDSLLNMNFFYDTSYGSM